MKRKEILEFIEQEKIVAIIRLNEQIKAPHVVKNLILGGIKVLEITSNTPGYLDEINNARRLYPNVLVGAGTVTDTRIAENAIKAGAQFLVTPNTNKAIVTEAHKYDIPVLMGALTPTEVCLAVEYGADIVKLFPAGNLGIDYFKAIRGPFNHVKFFIVGGIDLNNMQDWIEAGALGFGIGGSLMGSNENKEDIAKRVAKFIKLVKEI